MRISVRRFGILASTLLCSVVMVLGTSASAAPRAQDVDWAAVEQALGRSGAMMPGDVFRIGMPRADLKVTVEDAPVQAGFALGSYAAFKQYDGGTMAAGDLVLLDQELNGVMSGLFDYGFQVTGAAQPSEQHVAARHVHALRGARRSSRTCNRPARGAFGTRNAAVARQPTTAAITAERTAARHRGA
jgi:Domain of Unknown Function (DUF1259)